MQQPPDPYPQFQQPDYMQPQTFGQQPYTPPPLEPTQAAYRNPYEATSLYYGEIPPAPPPPPKQRHMALVVALVIALCLIVALGGVLLAGMHVGTEPRSTQATSTPTVAPSPTATPVLVTAQSIVHDFQSQGLPTENLSYGVTLSQWTGSYASTISEQGSAAFIDTAACGRGGACDAGGVWLGIYHSIGDAQAEYNGFLNWSSQQMMPGGGNMDINREGRCLLIGEDQTSAYVQIMQKDCT